MKTSYSALATLKCLSGAKFTYVALIWLGFSFVMGRFLIGRLLEYFLSKEKKIFEIKQEQVQSKMFEFFLFDA